MNYNSFFEIGGILIRGDFDPEFQSLSSLQLDDVAVERLERRRNSTKDESVRSGANETGESRPGLIEHYFRSLWYAGTEPTRRVLEDPSILIPARKNPRALVGVMFDITIESLENQYEYFTGGNPWD